MFADCLLEEVLFGLKIFFQGFRYSSMLLKTFQIFIANLEPPLEVKDPPEETP